MQRKTLFRVLILVVVNPDQWQTYSVSTDAIAAYRDAVRMRGRIVVEYELPPQVLTWSQAIMGLWEKVR